MSFDEMTIEQLEEARTLMQQRREAALQAIIDWERSNNQGPTTVRGLIDGSIPWPGHEHVDCARRDKMIAESCLNHLESRIAQLISDSVHTR
jgi:hypothetical protein